MQQFFSENSSPIPTVTLKSCRFLVVLVAFLLFGSPGWAMWDGDEIKPYDQNPAYWQYEGNPTMLVGGFPGAHNVFLFSDQETLSGDPLAKLDDLVASEGNVVRVILDPGWAIRHNFPAPYTTTNGKYNLTQFTTGSNSFWGKLDAFLDKANDLDVIVQLEIWDRFDVQDGHGHQHWNDVWQNHPFRPALNNDYDEATSGLSDRYTSVYHPDPINSPDPNHNPFTHSIPPGIPGIPAHPDYDSRYDTFRVHQEAYVEHILSITLNYDNVLYTMNNETREDLAWGRYWMKFITDEVADYNQNKLPEDPVKTVYVTDMYDDGYKANGDWDNTDHYPYAFDNPNEFTFLDISQNNAEKTHGGAEGHWASLKDAYAEVQAETPIRPINNTKVYGSDDHPVDAQTRHGDLAGQNSFWMDVIGGMASARFHRPIHGLGLGDMAKKSFDAVDILETKINMWDVEPDFDHTLLVNNTRGTIQDTNNGVTYVYGEAYLAYDDDGHQFALYFTRGGSVQLNLAGHSGNFDLTWINIDMGTEGTTTTIAGDSVVLISTPTTNEAWVAAIVPSSGVPPSFPAPILTPVPSSTLTETTVLFTGGHTSQDLEHWLYVSSTSALTHDLYDSGRLVEPANHAISVDNLPTTGTIWVEWWTKPIGGGNWASQVHTYTMNVP